VNAAILNLCLTVTSVIFVVMLVNVWVSHRSRRLAEASAGSLVTELIWSVIPWVIVVAAAAPAALEIMRHGGSQAGP
jgi:heme/copper-type cytochrome/quinol oxidase subunit 2